MTRPPIALGALAAVAVSAACAWGQGRREEIAALWSKLPRPRLAVAPTQQPPTVDGRIDKDEWQAASTASDFIGTDSPRWKGAAGFDLVEAQTAAYVTYDASHLYVAFRCEEPEIETLVVKGKAGRDGSIWNDDCVELFLAPPALNGYFHFIINSRGWIYDAKNSATQRRGKAWNLPGLKTAAWVSPPGKGSCWSVELALPFAGLGAAAPKRGEVWSANFARERWAALYKARTEFSSWSGLVGGFEQTAMFGELRFGEVQQAVRLGSPGVRPFLGAVKVAARLRNRGRDERKLKLQVRTVSAGGIEQVGAREVSLPRAGAGGWSTFDVPARIGTEGTQLLALEIAGAQTGRLLSCTRLPFHVPEVLTAAERAKARLDVLSAKARKGSDFARSIAQRAGEIASAAADARALLKSLPGEPADDALRARWRRLHDRVAKLAAGATFVVWTSSPYVATGPASMPPALAPPPVLKIEACRNEYEHAILNVTNLTDRAIEMQLDAPRGGLPGQVGRGRSGLNLPVQEVARHQPRLLGKKLKDLPDECDGLAMPLVELNALGTFSVGPFSTRQVWLTVQTRDLKPRTSRHTLTLRALSASLPPIPVPVEMTVWPIRLEDEAPIGVFCFDYAGDYRWLRRYKINVWFRGAFPNKLALDAAGELKPYKTDIDRVKKRIAEGARRFLFSYGYSGAFIQWAEKNKIAYMGPRFKRLFKQVLSRMVREWLAAGLRYEDFALQTIDEAHGRQVQQVIDTTPLIREVDAKVRLAMTIMTGLDDLKRMAAHVDVWLNRNGAIWGAEQAAFFGAERAKGKEIWSWNMPCTPRSKPLTQFRTYGWRAIKFDFDAIGFFNCFGMVYLPQRPGGGVATRHWEAWRDGVEDYQLLRVLRDEIAAARQRGLPADKLRAAEKLLADAVDGVITERFFPPNTQETDDRIRKARAAAAAEVLRLRRGAKARAAAPRGGAERTGG